MSNNSSQNINENCAYYCIGTNNSSQFWLRFSNENELLYQERKITTYEYIKTASKICLISIYNDAKLCNEKAINFEDIPYKCLLPDKNKLFNSEKDYSWLRTLAKINPQLCKNFLPFMYTDC